MDIQEEIDKLIYKKVKWNQEETLIRSQREKWRLGVNSFDKVLNHKIKLSVLGHFLYELNSIQIQQKEIQRDKMNMYEVDYVRKDNKFRLERENDITDDLVELINQMTQENKSGTITEKQFLEKLKILRITGNSIAELQSNRLKKLLNLEVLILAGNGINRRKRFHVPKNVKYLELFANDIINLSDFIKDLPMKLLHFGLGRNLLTNLTDIRDLSENQVLKNLLVLDLEENNIKDLDHIVDLLHNVTPLLCALTLQGNPCSYMPTYFYKIVKKLPKLMILDEEDVTGYNYNQPEITDELDPGISICCWRLIKIKKPETKKLNKKIQDTFHIEVETLLLDEGLRNWHEEKIQKSILSGMPVEEEEDILVTKPEEAEQTNQRPKTRKSKTRKSKTLKKKLEELPDVHELMLQDILRNDKQPPGVTKFESDKMPWSDIIVYKEPTIQLFIPNRKLELLRDTFRSQIIIRVVHIKALSPTKQKNKAKSTKESEPEPKEEIISREVVARIPIMLKTIKWNINYLHYKWDKENPHAAIESDNLQEINYAASKKGKRSARKSKTKNIKKNAAAIPTVELPDILTCHFGVGIIKKPVYKRIHHSI